MKARQFRSEFDNDVLVNIIGKDDFRYDVVKPIFEQFGFGFMVPTDYVVLIDGEQKLSKDVLKWIEAHEVAHFMLGHGLTKNNSAEEIRIRLTVGKLDPYDAPNYLRLCQLYVIEGNLADAMTMKDKVLAIAPNSEIADFALAAVGVN